MSPMSNSNGPPDSSVYACVRVCACAQWTWIDNFKLPNTKQENGAQPDATIFAQIHCARYWNVNKLGFSLNNQSVRSLAEIKWSINAVMNTWPNFMASINSDLHMLRHELIIRQVHLWTVQRWCGTETWNLKLVLSPWVNQISRLQTGRLLWMVALATFENNFKSPRRTVRFHFFSGKAWWI